jgi:geranylgeranyl diphosphate synthase, type II
MQTLARSTDELLALLSSNKAELDRIVLDFLPKVHDEESISQLYEMMSDYPRRGGKGIRGLMCVLWCELFGGDREDALITASALEIFQNWILIHDDIEDESDLRRGSPVLHKKYGVSLSINAGDALHGKMWELLLKNRSRLGDATTLSILSEFCTMLNETTEGQQMELSWTTENDWSINENDYFLMVTKKSAWYTCITPSKLGVIISSHKSAPPNKELLDLLVATGKHLGIAFQIIDDVLNLTASQAKYGKEIRGDIYEGKRTLMLIHLLNQSSADDKAKIVSIMAKPRSLKTETEVNWVIDKMESSGSLEYARSVARDYYEKSIEWFDRITRGLDSSRSETKQTIKLLYEYAAQRDY